MNKYTCSWSPEGKGAKTEKLSEKNGWNISKFDESIDPEIKEIQIILRKSMIKLMKTNVKKKILNITRAE
jgi:hypothetical protein